MKRSKKYVPLHKAYVSKKVIKGDEHIRALYDSAEWKYYRSKFLAVNRKCYACGETATVVDHLVPHKGDISLFWGEGNFLPLCKKHHDQVTNQFDKYFVAGGSVTKKVEFLQGYRFMADITFKVKVVPFDERILNHRMKLLSGGKGKED